MPQAPARKLHWTPRPEQFPGTVTTTDLPITMDDGVVLRADLVRPARADGSVVTRPLPVIITITAYNKSVLAAGGLGGPSAAYLVKRGYAQLTVDARGTGASEGVWEAFSPRETADFGQVVAWAHRQPWSNGKSGMTGPSYMGITPALRGRRAPARPQGDLPAGAGRGRLPRHRRVRRPDRRQLHPPLDGAGHRHRADPPGLRRGRPRLGDPRAARPAHHRDHVHRPTARLGGARRRPGLRRAVLPGPLADQRDQEGQGADVPGERRVRPVPARHPAAVREAAEAAASPSG